MIPRVLLLGTVATMLLRGEGTSGDPWGLDEVEHVAPPVLDADYGEDPDDADDAPAATTAEPVPSASSSEEVTPVYVPTNSTSPEQGRAELALRYTTDGELALLVYSSLDVLVQCCGEHQPWIAVPATHVSGIATTAEAETVLVDTAIPQQQWHTGEES